MGSFFSKNTSNTKTTKDSFTNFYEVIDYIATYYILTSSFTIVLHHHQDPFTLAAVGIGVSLWPV